MVEDIARIRSWLGGPIISRSWQLAAVAGAIGSLLSLPAEAAENATSFFIGGTKGPQAGMTPPPGFYFSDTAYFYSGSASKSVEIVIGGKIQAGVDTTLFLNMPTGLWVADSNILGGRPGVALTMPFGSADVDAAAQLSTPIRTLGTSAHDSVTTFADPVLSSFVGWDSGNLHWQLGVSVNVPIGDYQEGELANIALHRWAGDFYGAATWLDPNSGLELSGVMGIIFNGENSVTDYQTGTEFHADVALSQHVSQALSIGLASYYYDQVTGDSGKGAVLGDFEGRAAAIGAILGYNFQLGKLPVSTSLRYFHEILAEKRLEGDSGLLTVTLPLWAPVN